MIMEISDVSEKDETSQEEENTSDKKQLNQQMKKKFRITHPVGLAIFSIIIFLLGTMYSELKFVETVQELTDAENNKFVPRTGFPYSVYGDMEDPDYFENIYVVLYFLDYVEYENVTSHNFLYAMEYPFKELADNLTKLQPHVKVNFLPGLQAITNKGLLVSTQNRFMPTSFRIPDEKDNFLEYSKDNPNKYFMEKNISHGNTMIKDVDQINLDDESIFIQEYIGNPLLVNGLKFEIGVYAIITSLDPLRIYIYNADANIRYCRSKYYPFDPMELTKYITSEDYLPTWEVPSLSPLFMAFGLTMKESFDIYFNRIGVDTAEIWKQIEEAITETLLDNAGRMMDPRFKRTHHFYEMVRFDFIVDDTLRVYLLEITASPNVCSTNMTKNSLLFEQLLYSTFSIAGVAQRTKKPSLKKRFFLEEVMQSAERNILEDKIFCARSNCRARCNDTECSLCRVCLDLDMIEHLYNAYKEHLNRIEYKRLFPPKLYGRNFTKKYLKQFSPRNQISLKWYNAKCKQDNTWC